MFFLVDYLYIIKKYDLDSNWLYYLFQIAHHCFKDTQNFNSMFAITAGLTHSSVCLFICLLFIVAVCLHFFKYCFFFVKLQVQRLKNTKDRLSPKYKKLLDDMTSYMDPTRNFSKYRNLISNSSVSEYFFIISQIQYKSTYLVN